MDINNFQTKKNNRVEENKKKFIKIFKENIKREGSEELLEYLINSDFFTAPASTRYHLNVDGGLCEHSLNVYNNIKRDGAMANFSEETIAIVTLLHDLCKTNFYTPYYRNVKNDKGNWVQVREFKIDELFPYGHGEKSVFLIERYMKLSSQEALAIRYHMGFEENDHGASGKAFELTPLLVYLHISDLESSFITENEKISDSYK